MRPISNKKTKNYRTFFIESAASLEVQLEWIISSFFSKGWDNYVLFNYLFFSDDVELGFYDKIRMFEKLLDSIPDFKKQHSGIITELNQVRKVRNLFSHGTISAPRDGDIKKLKKQIFFTVVEKGENKEVSYTYDYLKKVETNCKDLRSVLASLIRKFKSDNKITIGFLRKHKIKFLAKKKP